MSIGPFRLGRNLLAEHGLSGGSFGTLFEATGPDGQPAVAKFGRDSGGGRENTYSDLHLPDVAFNANTGDWWQTTLPADEVDEVLLAEADILRIGDGRLLPRLLGVFDGPSGRPVVVMERVVGRRPRTVDDVRRVLEELAASVRAGALDYHGDLKPEHVFVAERVRLVDPAPRLDATRHAAFTPEYNPLGMSGPPADVFAVCVLVYQAVTGTNPFRGPGRAGRVIPRLPKIPPMPREGTGLPDGLADAVDSLFGAPPYEWWTWVLDHSTAFEHLFAGPAA
jgi:hypothetical protein